MHAGCCVHSVRLVDDEFHATHQSIFRSCRLNTIMDNDYVLVMGDGRMVEFGPPAELLSRNGAFSDLVDSTGPESARALRNMAIDATTERISADT